MQPHLIQRSKAWFQFRYEHIGASDASAIMGVSPWKNVNQLYIEKTQTQENHVQLDNYAINRGIALEPVALSVFESETGHLMQPRVMVHPTISYMSASLDGLSLDEDVAVEIKCPGKKDHDLALSGKVPEKYIPQLQHQMAVLDHDMIYYFSFHEDSHALIEVKRDDEYIKDLIEKESEFWKCVMDKNPPAPQKKDFTTNESEKFRIAKERYQEFYEQESEITLQLEQAKEDLLEIAGYCNTVGCGISIQRIERKGNLDYSSIPELKNLDLEKYRKPPTESWRITFK